MPSFKHKKIVGKILELDALPGDPAKFSEWVGARAHLDFLTQNALTDEIVVYGSGPYAFIHSIVIPDEALAAASQDDLLSWSCNPYTSIAGYVSGGGRDGMWIEHGGRGRGSEPLDEGTDLIFGRTFEGWSGDDQLYFEVRQEYTHLSEIHWRPEEQAYCRFDDNGDLRHVVSITSRSAGGEVSLVSFTWAELEEYLTIAKSSLLRMFDFTLLRRNQFGGWPDIPEQIHVESDDLFYRQRHCGNCAYTRGVQLIRPLRTTEKVHQDVVGGWHGKKGKQYVEFIAHDFRNQRITKISTDPVATTNYFLAKENEKPFELSPAFFRPEVLSKYKTDREKYIVKDREVSCRAAWSLRGYDVNEAGQVHAYICDLRSLPYAEQLHWLSFNVEPLAAISKRAVINDFEGEFVTFLHPREEIMSIARRWNDRDVEWWKLRNAEMLDRANIPITTSKDEWSEAVMDLAKLVVEGFEAKVLRKRLEGLSVEFDAKDQTIALLEKLLNFDRYESEPASLAGMREAQRIRSKVKGHVAGSEANQIAKAAISDHGSYKEHFTNLCSRIAAELEAVGFHFEGKAPG